MPQKDAIDQDRKHPVDAAQRAPGPEQAIRVGSGRAAWRGSGSWEAVQEKSLNIFRHDGKNGGRLTAWERSRAVCLGGGGRRPQINEGPERCLCAGESRAQMDTSVYWRKETICSTKAGGRRVMSIPPVANKKLKNDFRAKPEFLKAVQLLSSFSWFWARNLPEPLLLISTI